MESNQQVEGAAEAEEFVWDGSMEAGLLGGGCSVGSATEPEAEHVHGPGCGHNHVEGATPDMADLEANLTEVAYALHERYGDAGPTPEQEKEFMKEWLQGKGRSEEEINAILDS